MRCFVLLRYRAQLVRFLFLSLNRIQFARPEPPYIVSILLDTESRLTKACALSLTKSPRAAAPLAKFRETAVGFNNTLRLGSPLPVDKAQSESSGPGLDTARTALTATALIDERDPPPRLIIIDRILAHTVSAR